MRTFVSDPELDSIVGAFEHVDRHLFRALLGDPEAHGDLAEIGVWYGQSAILIGDYVRDDETFTVIDLLVHQQQIQAIRWKTRTLTLD